VIGTPHRMGGVRAIHAACVMPPGGCNLTSDVFLDAPLYPFPFRIRHGS